MKINYNKYTMCKYLLFTFALFCNAMGVAFITKALLGTSPISSLMYVLSMFTPLTMGQWTIIINLLFVALELPLMSRKELKDDRLTYLLQIPISLLNGLFIDLGMTILAGFVPATYIAQIVSLVIGCIVLALGISLEVKASVALISGEYFVRVIARRLKKEFGYVKLGFDVSLVILAGVFSLVFMHGIYGLREGTVIAALIVGPIVAFITPFIRFIDPWLGTGTTETETQYATESATGPFVITIARELGSGGRQLAQLLSQKLGLPVYDRELVREAADVSGIDAEFVAANDQHLPSYLLNLLTPDASNRALKESMSSDTLIFLAQSAVIRDWAAKGSCIIVGRCADYVLRDRKNLLRIFCYANLEDEVSRCVNSYGMTPEESVEKIQSVNQGRALHYHYFSGQGWNDPSHYDLMINTSTITLDEALKMVSQLYTRLSSEVQLSPQNINLGYANGVITD